MKTSSFSMAWNSSVVQQGLSSIAHGGGSSYQVEQQCSLRFNGDIS
jgi:hypothetical protein